ncbi:uncharacterized protein TM35_000083290 [Trypanosoma theileri]|uniref:Uncharacterized protein n=1 Tax=Trypanosoma theileri TaxID=67003 RepID=A0A1X0P116_9TRYP|nr:uncharacterized protein TM35_000083290 [Trypanosoma theileri]ORC90531.1 hypothetical protein TM35_000083290 [Trypanosoma theileri]
MRSAASLFNFQRREHVSRASGNSEVVANCTTGGASRTSRRSLRARDWLHLDPVEKWTMLIDLGRRTPLLLEEASVKREEMIKEKGNGIRGLVMTFLSPLLRYRFSAASDVSKFVDGEKVRISTAGIEQHRRLVHAFPYPLRLQICLSMMMWVSSLREVQDAFARLRLPFANTHRLRSSVVADVFPTRISDWLVDPFTTVRVKMNESLNSTAEQVPAPHAWLPEGAKEEEETKKKIKIQGRSINKGRLGINMDSNSLHNQHASHYLQSSRKNSKSLLRTVQGMYVRPSDDDDLAAKLTRRSSHRAAQRTLCKRQTSLKEISSLQNPSWAVNDALRSAIPSPLAMDHEEDEKYHHNFLRGEGCPLDENGKLASTPIYIRVPVTPDHDTLARYCIMAHAAILSSLFIEGRTVCFSTNHPFLLDYVKFLFEEFIEDGWITSSLSDDNSRPYLPPWSIKESVLVVLPPKRGNESFKKREIRYLANIIINCTPCSVLIETREAPQSDSHHYSKALMEEVEGLLSKHITPETKDRWRVSWVPLSSSTTTTSKSRRVPFGGSADDVSCNFQSNVNEILRQFYSVTFLYAPSNCRFTPRQVREWWWNELPNSIHIVGVNNNTLDLLYYFPQAPFLHKKIGNSFRYRAVERVVFGNCMHTDIHTSDGRYFLSYLNWLYWYTSPTARREGLRGERTVDYLSAPSKITGLALITAKLFRL